MQVVEHLHLEVVVAHGEIAVFGHNEVDADDVGIGRSDFKAEQGLGEDLLGRVAAEDLIKPVDVDVAGGRFGRRGVAVLDAVAVGFGAGELLHVGGDFVAQAGRE